MQDLQILHNQNHQKDLSFIGFFESSYYVFLAKDLIKLCDQETFQNKNTY